MKHLPLFLLLTLATAVAEVPSLINYQGRLVTADGAAQSGQKTFLLQVFGAASGGSLLYREEIGNITLGEGGVYSFQFGGSGTSNAQITETIGTGGEAVLYQQVLSNLPVVAGSVSVSDGTYTWSQASGSSNEDDFSAAFSTNLNRITVNYFSGAPNDGRSIDVTYRYESEGITGALSSGGEHWLQLTIDGDVQATRERVLAVPFALRAGGILGRDRAKSHFYVHTFPATHENRTSDLLNPPHSLEHGNDRETFRFILPAGTTKAIDFTSRFRVRGAGYRVTIHAEIYQLDHGEPPELIDSRDLVLPPNQEDRTMLVGVPLNITVDPRQLHILCVWSSLTGLGEGRYTNMYGQHATLTYEE
jgi:hypothetical protein